jgi:cytochrome c556
MSLRDVIASLFGFGLQKLSKQEEPRDLTEFREAKARLRKNSKAFSREVDKFGNLVHEMRGPVVVVQQIEKPPQAKNKATKLKSSGETRKGPRRKQSR